MAEDPSHASQYFAARPEVASHPREITLTLPDVTLTLTTDRGVFAASTVDPGTRLLLMEGARPPATGHVVDVGCGYGPIALTLAHRAPATTVWATDVNERALALCAANAARAGLTNVRIGEPPADVGVDAIFSNPPVRIGKAALHDLLASWLNRLTPAGFAEIVIQRHLGADSLARWLSDEGWDVQRIVSRGGYRLLRIGRA
jgi:16S rRNA (guanine1207-N2)-methyltransferase